MSHIGEIQALRVCSRERPLRTSHNGENPDAHGVQERTSVWRLISDGREALGAVVWPFKDVDARPWPRMISPMLRTSIRAALAFVISLVPISVGGCSLKPRFSEPARVGFGCYTESGSNDFEVEFHGVDAVIHIAEEAHQVRFVPSVWPRLEDKYAADGYVLTIDPEAYLVLPNGARRGPCNG